MLNKPGSVNDPVPDGELSGGRVVAAVGFNVTTRIPRFDRSIV